jgi:hypothetical protein
MYYTQQFFCSDLVITYSLLPSKTQNSKEIENQRQKVKPRLTQTKFMCQKPYWVCISFQAAIAYEYGKFSNM